MGGVQYVLHLVGNHLFDGFAALAQVGTGIEVFRMFCQVLADGSGHGQTQVSIDVDFADAEGAGFFQHIFRAALCAFDFAAKFVAFCHEFRQYGGSTMEYQGEAGQQVGDFFQTGKVQFGFAFKFVGAVAGADGDGQGVNAGAFYEFYSLVRIGVGGVFGVDLDGIFYAGQFALARS